MAGRFSERIAEAFYKGWLRAAIEKDGWQLSY
jgi:hypothetical protein